MELSGKKIALLIEENFEDLEALYPYYRMKEAGAEVTVVGTGEKTYHGKKGHSIKADTSIDKVKSEDFDAIIIPGGKAPERLRTNSQILDFVKKAYAQEKPISAICHGPQVLASAGLVSGKKLTCYPPIKDELIAAGAEFVNKAVVKDGNFITSRFPQDLPYFCREIIESLK